MKFIYHNINPDGDREQDCVTRAISLCCNLPYSTVRSKLYHTSKLLDCEKLCVCCYKFLIEEVLKCRRVNCDGMRVGDFAYNYPNGTYLVRMDGHISSVINGDLWDTWDCRDRIVTDAWEVK